MKHSKLTTQWLKTHYPLNVWRNRKRVHHWSWRKCLEFSIHKWEGLNAETLLAHRLHTDGNVVAVNSTNHALLSIGPLSCPLCIKSSKSSDPDCHACILDKYGPVCDDSAWWEWTTHRRTEPMLQLLRSALDWETQKK